MDLESNPEGRLLEQISIQKHDLQGQHAVFAQSSTFFTTQSVI